MYFGRWLQMFCRNPLPPSSTLKIEAAGSSEDVEHLPAHVALHPRRPQSSSLL
jgi:hypothetical protein